MWRRVRNIEEMEIYNSGNQWEKTVAGRLGLVMSHTHIRKGGTIHEGEVVHVTIAGSCGIGISNRSGLAGCLRDIKNSGTT